MYDLIEILNSGVLASSISAAFGASGGALIVTHIEKREKKQQNLSRFNSGIILLANATNVLIELKKDKILPMHEQIKKLSAEYHDKKISNFSKIINDYNLVLKNITEPQVDIQFNFKFLCDFATVNPKALMLCQKAMENLDMLKVMIKKRNNLIANINSEPDESDKRALKCLGISDERNQTQDNLFEFAKDLNKQVDYCLFYANNALAEFKKAGLRIIPKKWHEKIISTNFIDPSDEKYLPSNNFISN